MKENFVSYNSALKLKELGFDEPCLAYYLLPEIERTGEIILHYCARGKEILKNEDWSWVYQNFPMFRKYLKAEHCYKYSLNRSKIYATAPLLQQAQKWLREKHDIHIVIQTGVGNSIWWSYQLIEISTNDLIFDKEGSFNTFESALEEALSKSLELIN